MQQLLLAVEGIRAGYGESRVLRDVTLEIPVGHAVCLIGRNGVGKTTLIKSVMGLVKVRSGRILVDGQDVTAKRPEERARLGLGYVPQGRGIFPHLSVFENILMGFEARPKINAGDRQESLDEVYALFPVLQDMRQRVAGTLSGGQQQQLAIARALVSKPRLLLLDEPTEGIQPSIVQQIEEVLIQLHQRGIALLLVEQFVDFAVATCDEYVVLDRGSVVEKGATAALDQSVIDEYLAV
ncbi:MAG: urea ABC transporter ATP-binding subunit UrtE [Chloroflexota bacterium]